ncbi:hypothetical protein M4951_08155 [Blastopirellula sp. J2-11]|uniref:hypothetical protein n=1 Tax=Blastopirellula sp. J2-11 TaxID=2943192 RepID=UPI0021CA077E|nr:hypothetical protein [Blastopirellula sp. J2-11]UUO08281.1 hypothetical protein M4951_08155 [Blastopirellula sp. J2-11]
MTNAFHLTWVGVAGCLLCLGCGPSLGRPLDPGKPIVIQILSGGSPIDEGLIDLSGAGGGAKITSNGEANFEHVPFGAYKVVVHPPMDLSNVAPLDNSDQLPVAKKAQSSLIPRKFQSEQTTPLQIEVTEGDADRFEFDLKK